MVDTIRTIKAENSREHKISLKKIEEKMKKIEISKIEDLPFTFLEK